MHLNKQEMTKTEEDVLSLGMNELIAGIKALAKQLDVTTALELKTHYEALPWRSHKPRAQSNEDAIQDSEVPQKKKKKLAAR